MEKQISHFKILEEIGSGGMGVVYRARDLRLRRKVALKVLPAGTLAAPTVRERLLREARSVSSLTHPHIVTVFETHCAGDRDFIAMEFVEGRSLDLVIGSEGLPLEKALRYAIQIADGLACAHEHGVIHRDLKPQNIMITPDDEVKILDFGLSKRFAPAGDPNVEPGLVTLTAPGVKIGTPAYMSPEQVESKRIDGRSDVFSFGSLFYQMLTSVVPFQRRNALLIFKAVLSDQPKPVRSIKPELPVGLEPILSRAMKKSPEDRHQYMRELLAELEAVYAELFGANHSRVIAVPAHRRFGALRPLLLIVPVLAVACLTWWLSGRSTEVPRLVAHRSSANAWSLAVESGKAAFAPSEDAEPPASIPPAFFARWVARSPALSPDGRSIVFFQPQAGSIGDLWVVPATGGAPRRLLGKAFRGGDPVWTPDGRWIVFWADFTGEINLWCVPAEGGDPERLTYGPGRHSAPEVSGDGSRIRYTVAGPSYVLERRSVEDHEQQRLIASRHEIIRPAVSPSGDRVAFFSPDGPDVHLFVVGTGGGNPRRVTGGAGESNVLPQWSADGSHLYYYQEQPTRSFRVVPASGGVSVVVIEDWSRLLQFDTAVDPSGERVVYVPIEAGSPLRLRVRDLEGGREQVLGATLLAPRWSPDGGQVLGYGAEGRIYLCPAAGGDCRFLADGFAPRWGPHAGTVTFARGTPATGPGIRSLSIWTLATDALEGRKIADVETVHQLAFDYGFTQGGDLIWNRKLSGHEERWVADFR